MGVYNANNPRQPWGNVTVDPSASEETKRLASEGNVGGAIDQATGLENVAKQRELGAATQAGVNQGNYQWGGPDQNQLGLGTNNYAQQGEEARQNSLQARSGQSQYLAMLQGQANGTGGPSAAQGVLRQGTDQAIAAGNSLAASAHGNAAQMAAAQRAAQFGAGEQAQAGANQGAMLRAGEQQHAQALYGNALEQQRAQDMQSQAMAGNLQSNYLGQQMNQGQAQLGANEAYQNAKNNDYYRGLDEVTGRQQFSVQQANQTQQQQFGNTMQGVGTTAATVAPLLLADARLQEPGGTAAWSLREEDNFILARNDRTGEMRKVATQPLSPHERAQAEAPHGAGRLGSNDSPMTKTFGDMSLGGGGGQPQYLGMIGRHALSEGTKAAAPAPAPPNVDISYGVGRLATHLAALEAERHARKGGR